MRGFPLTLTHNLALALNLTLITIALEANYDHICFTFEKDHNRNRGTPSSHTLPLPNTLPYSASVVSRIVCLILYNTVVCNTVLYYTVLS